jgi:hypothetical protein
MAAKKKRVSKAVTPAFELVLELGGRMYSSSGDTMLEALQSLPKPPKIVSKATLYISMGAVKRERLLQIAQTKRLFFPLSQKIIAKQLQVGLS